MSHELTTHADGRTEMAYVGETPWHGLGNQLEPGAPIETWLQAAGMEWKIKRSRVRYATDRLGADLRVMDDRHVLLRGDSGDALGIVSDRYEIVQPAQVIEFFRDLTEAAGFELETAGTLFGGRKFWALAKTRAESVIVDKRDRVKAHLMLATACDGSMATEASYVATRVVCNNTLKMATAEGGRLKVAVRHSTKFRPEAVKKELGIEAAQSAFERTVDAMRAMAEFEMSNDHMLLAACLVVNPNVVSMDKDAREKLMRSKPVQAIGRLAIDREARGSEFAGTKNTVYGWLNAVTEYVDHQGRAHNADNRLDSAWFGRGMELKERAFEMAGAMIETNPRPKGEEGGYTSVQEWIDNHS